MRWRAPGGRSGPVSLAVLALVAGLGVTWLTWPVWSSFTAPDRDAVTELTPSLLAALTGLLLLLGWALWHEAGSRIFAPIVTLSFSAAVIRMFMLPSSSGLEPVFALPLLAGVTLGAPAGFLTGALACLASSAAMGLISAPLTGQCLIWGLWGVGGGLLRTVGDRGAWLGAIALTFVLGVASGLGLNLIGWTGERTAEVGAFLPGVGPAESAQRLWAYTRATSGTYDLMRALSTAVLVALIGLPVIRAVREVSVGRITTTPPRPTRPPAISLQSLSRRERSDRLTTLWTQPQGEMNDRDAGPRRGTVGQGQTGRAQHLL